MPRKNYMTILVFDTVQLMFDEFVARKEIPKTVALNDMLELYMLAKDETLYLELKRKYLNVEGVRQMIVDKDSDISVSSDELFIFMRLGHWYDRNGISYDGNKTIQVYIDDAKNRGYTWFSTQSLYYGMSKKQVNAYNKAIEAGKKVTLLFCFSISAGGDNDIAYKADIMEIVSYKEPKVFPNNDYPAIWHGEPARIWIKIRDIQKENVLTAKLFQVTSSGADLQTVINNSQYHFGYVSLK